MSDDLPGVLFRGLCENSILAYDCFNAGAGFVLDREEEESDEDYEARVSHFSKLFS